MATKVKKVSLAIGREEFAWAQKRARQEGTSVSAVLTDAARRVRQEEEVRAKKDAAWKEVLEWALEGKPLTDEERAEADRILDGDGDVRAPVPRKSQKARSRRERRVA